MLIFPWPISGKSVFLPSRIWKSKVFLYINTNMLREISRAKMRKHIVDIYLVAKKVLTFATNKIQLFVFQETMQSLSLRKHSFPLTSRGLWGIFFVPIFTEKIFTTTFIFLMEKFFVSCCYLICCENNDFSKIFTKFEEIVIIPKVMVQEFSTNIARQNMRPFLCEMNLVANYSLTL